MRIALCSILALNLSIPASAQAPGPIRSSLHRLPDLAPPADAAGAPQSAGGSLTAGWSQVQRLRSGQEIQITRGTARRAPRHVVTVDHQSITLLNLSHPALTSAARQALIDVATLRPDRFTGARQGTAFDHQDVRVAPEGIFVATVRVANLQDLVETIARDEVVEIRGAVVKRGSGWGALAGGFGGFIAGLYTTVYLGFKQCGGSCKDEGALILTSLIGMPIGGGLAGYHGLARRTRPLIYRRAP